MRLTIPSFPIHTGRLQGGTCAAFSSFPIHTGRLQCGTCAALFAVCPQASGRCMICGYSQMGKTRQTVETPSCFCQSSTRSSAPNSYNMIWRSASYAVSVTVDGLFLTFSIFELLNLRDCRRFNVYIRSKAFS